MTNEPELFIIGDHVDFNPLGKAAQVAITPPNGHGSWTIMGFKHVESPPAPHPQLLDLGSEYPIGLVSGMFLTKKNGAMK